MLASNPALYAASSSSSSGASSTAANATAAGAEAASGAAGIFDMLPFILMVGVMLFIIPMMMQAAMPSRSYSSTTRSSRSSSRSSSSRSKDRSGDWDPEEGSIEEIWNWPIWNKRSKSYARCRLCKKDFGYLKHRIFGLLHAYEHYQEGHRLADLPESEVQERSSPGHECSTCGKTFDTERGLMIHQAQKDHGGDDQ